MGHGQILVMFYYICHWIGWPKPGMLLLKAAAINNYTRGSLGGSVVGACLWPRAEPRDQVLHRAPGMEPASPSACVSASLSLSVSIMNK